MFRILKRRTRERFVCGEEGIPEDLRKDALVFGFGPGANVRGTNLELSPAATRFRVDDVEFTLPVPGAHNVENALGAIAACRALGVELAEMRAGLASFRGVARRFQSLGSARGVEVVDDFGHNPAKIAASLATARLRAKRVLAVYQPHGYGPTRFLRDGFVDTFATQTAPGDKVWLLEIFYAGGTAQRDFSAGDLVRDIVARGRDAEFAPSREWLVRRIAEAGRARRPGAGDGRARPVAHDIRERGAGRAGRGGMIARLLAAAWLAAAPMASSTRPSPPSAQPLARFDGRWLLDAKRSEFGGAQSVLRAREDNIVTDGERLHVRSRSIRASGDSTGLDYSYRADGTAENTLSGQSVRTTGRHVGAALEFVSIMKLVLVELKVEERWSLAAHGDTLVMERSAHTPLGNQHQALYFARPAARERAGAQPEALAPEPLRHVVVEQLGEVVGDGVALQRHGQLAVHEHGRARVLAGARQ